MKPKVLIMMGSASDASVMEKAGEVLGELGIPFRMTVSSAHRTPERTLKIIRESEKEGVEVIIAGAGMAAHLPGVIASHTILPVIGVPIDASSLIGLDALLSIVQMPPGIPVGTVAVGKAGAKNAAFLAAQILALKDRKVAAKLREGRRKMAKEVEEKDRELQRGK